ncbi:MAG: COX15/CtaA family protein [Candidatus Binataceae bacterium]
MNRPNTALHRFAVFTAAATFVLIFAGGLVTSTGSALAVPDWPLSFGKFFPKLEGGVLYEHGHRMIAATVTLLTLVLMVWVFRAEHRIWVKRLAAAAFGLIVVQAVLGGLTVLFLLPLPIAVAHAATAQAFLCLVVALAIFTNPRWESAGRETPVDSGRSPLAILAAVTTGAIYLQILLGALIRHMGAGLAIPDFPLSFGRLVPPLDSQFVAVNFAHRCGAVVVTALVIFTVVRTLGTHRDQAWLRRPALGLLVLLSAQLCLGAITVWSGKAVVPTTAHVALGAGVLAMSLMLTLRAFRILRAAPARDQVRELSPTPPHRRIADDRVIA